MQDAPLDSAIQQILYSRTCRQWLYQNLFSISPVMLEINGLWHREYKDLRPFDLTELVANGIPSPGELKDRVARMSAEFKDTVLLNG